MVEVEKRAFFVDRKKGIMIDPSKIGKPIILFLDIILLIRKKREYKDKEGATCEDIVF
jgi:hypothetical protein